MSTTYDKDLTIWAKDTAQLLRERCWDAIDWEHLIEEVEDLGKSERSAIGSQMERIMVHLLKWQYQPQQRSDSWLDSINDGRSRRDPLRGAPFPLFASSANSTNTPRGSETLRARYCWDLYHMG